VEVGPRPPERDGIAELLGDGGRGEAETGGVLARERAVDDNPAEGGGLDSEPEAIGYRPEAIGYRLGAIGYRLSAIGREESDVCEGRINLEGGNIA
jgi:hypothetical protein